MIRWIATLLIVALVGWVGVVSAQQQPTAPAPAGQAATPEKVMQGTVKTVDEAKRQVTLDDGTVLTIPAMVQVSWTELKPGKTVAVSYTETGEAGQQKSVKKIEVK
jgi:Cu/Ag efflux protein CusF